jgi:NIMA (never in mitosis gene a)-related kinase
MESPQEDSCLIILKNEKEPKKMFKATKFRTLLIGMIDMLKLKCLVPYDISIEEYLQCQEFKIDFVIISLEIDNIEHLFVKIKSLYPYCSVIITYSVTNFPNLKQLENLMTSIEDKYQFKNFIEQGSINIKTLENLFIKIKCEKTNSKLYDLSISNCTNSERDKYRYCFIKKLDEGSSGVVCLYKDQVMDMLVAVKHIKIDGLSVRERSRVRMEVEYMSKLKAPTIISFYNSTFDNENRYIYMEYADGGCLEKKIHTINRSKENWELQILDWLIEIMIALYVFNKNKMAHRDIKPGNILLQKCLTHNNEEHLIAKLSDFGISKILRTNEFKNTLCGTPYYLSPEIVSGLEYSYNTDIWSLGVLLYEMITGNKPFFKPTEMELYESIKNDDYDPLPLTIDRRLLYLIEVMMVKNPNCRLNLEEILSLDFINYRLHELISLFKWEEKVPFFKELCLIKKKVCIFNDTRLLNAENIKLFKISILILKNCKLHPYKPSYFKATSFDVITNKELIEVVMELFPDNYTGIISELHLRKVLRCLCENCDKESCLKDILNVSDNKLVYFRHKQKRCNLEYQNIHIINQNSQNHYDLLELTKLLVLYNKKLFPKILGEGKLQATSNFEEDEEYLNFIYGISLFNFYDILDIEKEKQIVCLLNILQIMFLDYLLLHLSNNLNNSPKKYSFLNFFSKEEKIKNITYKFKDIEINSFEIINICLLKRFSHFQLFNNEKTTLLLNMFVKEKMDLRVLLLLHDFDEKMDLAKNKFYPFSLRNLNCELDEIVMNFIQDSIRINEEGTIFLPSFIKPLLIYFGSSGELDFFKFLFNFIKHNNEKPKILKLTLSLDHLKPLFKNPLQLLKKISLEKIKIIYV